MDHSDVQVWLDRYIEAWRHDRADLVEALFSTDAVYRYRPYGDGTLVQGIADIVSAWTAVTDDPEGWEAIYMPFAVDGDRVVAYGTSRYLATGDRPEEVYHNCFLLRFDSDGRCAELTEYWMLEPKDD